MRLMRPMACTTASAIAVLFGDGTAPSPLPLSRIPRARTMPSTSPIGTKPWTTSLRPSRSGSIRMSTGVATYMRWNDLMRDIAGTAPRPQSSH